MTIADEEKKKKLKEQEEEENTSILMSEETFKESGGNVETHIPDDEKINLRILETHKDKIEEYERRRKSYAMIVRRGVVTPTGERKEVLEIEVRHSFRFRRFVKKLAKEGYFTKEHGTWVLKKNMSSEEFMNLMSSLRNYVKDVFVEDSVYEEVYDTLQRIVIPDPQKIMREKVAPAENKNIMWKGETPARFQKGDTVSMISENEGTAKSRAEIEKELLNSLKTLNGLMQTFVTLVKKDGKTQYIVPSINANPNQLIEHGFKKDMDGWRKEIPKNVMFSELQPVKNTLGNNYISMETNPNAFEQEINRVVNERKAEAEQSAEAEIQ